MSERRTPGWWLPDHVSHRDQVVDLSKQRVIAVTFLWLAFVASLCLDGLYFTESGLTFAGAVCCAALTTIIVMSIVLGLVLWIWTEFVG